MSEQTPGEQNRSLDWLTLAGSFNKQFEQLPVAEQTEFWANESIKFFVRSVDQGPGGLLAKVAELGNKASVAGLGAQSRRYSSCAERMRPWIKEAKDFLNSDCFRSEVKSYITARLEKATSFDAQESLIEMLQQRLPQGNRALRLALHCADIEITSGTPADLEKILDDLESEYRDDQDRELDARLEMELSQPKVDESAFVAAKTLREQRGMTAAACNKFLTQHGTKSAQSVDGKVRYHKPNKKRLDIHASDWLTFWQNFDRRQSDALDEDAMQDFLANAEAEKAKVKAKRKLGRASSRQVS